MRYMRDDLKDAVAAGIDLEAFLVDQTEQVVRLVAKSHAQTRGGAGPYVLGDHITKDSHDGASEDVGTTDSADDRARHRPSDEDAGDAPIVITGDGTSAIGGFFSHNDAGFMMVAIPTAAVTTAPKMDRSITRRALLRPSMNPHSLPYILRFPGAGTASIHCNEFKLRYPFNAHFCQSLCTTGHMPDPYDLEVYTPVPWTGSAVDVQGGLDGVIYAGRIPPAPEGGSFIAVDYRQIIGYDLYHRQILHANSAVNRAVFGRELSDLLETLESSLAHASPTNCSQHVVCYKHPLGDPKFYRTCHHEPVTTHGTSILHGHIMRPELIRRGRLQLDVFYIATAQVAIAIIYGFHWNRKFVRSVLFGHADPKICARGLPEHRVMIHQDKGSDGVWRWDQRFSLLLPPRLFPHGPLPDGGIWQL